MKKITLRSAVLGMLFSFVVLMGCEFESGGSGGFNTSLFGWVNFSGVYREGEGGFLVSEFTASGGTNAVPAGSTGVEVIQFTVFQSGNVLEIVDNNGAKYVGQFGKVENTAGAVAEFTAEGLSASGIPVLMVGTFQGVVDGSTLSDRRVLGTWIETGGVTGQIDGRAAPISI